MPRYAMDESVASPSYLQRQCHEYAKLGLMGVTVLYSSGDYGVAGNNGFCLGTSISSPFVDPFSLAIAQAN